MKIPLQSIRVEEYNTSYGAIDLTSLLSHAQSRSVSVPVRRHTYISSTLVSYPLNLSNFWWHAIFQGLEGMIGSGFDENKVRVSQKVANISVNVYP